MGSGSGKGDSRVSGPGGDATGDVIPPWERWEIRYQATSVDDYATKLDHFNIELGLMGGGKSEREYVSNMTGSMKKYSSKDIEDRLYFNYTGGPMRDMDLTLLARAGYDTKRREPAQF